MTGLDAVLSWIIRWIPAPYRDRVHFAWRYRRGSTPWDSGQTPPEVVAWAEGQPAGKMLDLGCGTGTNVLFFATRGWAAAGVDFTAQAIAMAERKREASGLTATFMQGDVSHLERLPLDPPYDLLLDIGCLHGLNAAQQPRYATQAAALTRAGATFLLYAAIPGEQARPSGIAPARVKALFEPAFAIPSQVVDDDRGGRWRGAWYRMERRA
ncbi:MAG: class I SAM-dependent methyltransferase [Anaerolineales bacterium]|nr:class I SAM-dependent methyltransferase [Anaerolineales bacterium]MCB9126731.1 class I SAM-dependent methyltransferase [Ardenticatenales bacterium]